MACYISSNDNRFYVQSEEAYGVTREVTAAERISSVGLTASQVKEKVKRQDKTGTRTYPGMPTGVRSRTDFGLRTYLTTWTDQTAGPAYGALFNSALGGAVERCSGLVVDSMSGTRLTLRSDHGLAPLAGVAMGSEIRFVAAVPDSRTVDVNAPFTIQPTGGTVLGTTMTYRLGARPRSISIFDYWSPVESVQRLLCGAVVDEMKMSINGDFHEFAFSGAAADLVDSASFASGQAGLAQFPEEPPLGAFDYSIVPGHLGQAWIGVAPERLYTLTQAEIRLRNNVSLRAKEFGRDLPACFNAGTRDAMLSFSIYERPDGLTRSLYEAARFRVPVSVMFQLGEQPGQLCGVYMKSVVPEVPEFDDGDSRLAWRFQNCRAEGTGDDELVIALG
jgi:hypothetical protein